MNYESDEIPIKPYTIKELAAIYKVTPKIFMKLIEDIKDEIGPRLGHYYNVVQVRFIFATKGIPGRLRP